MYYRCLFKNVFNVSAYFMDLCYQFVNRKVQRHAKQKKKKKKKNNFYAVRMCFTT